MNFSPVIGGKRAGATKVKADPNPVTRFMFDGRQMSIRRALYFGPIGSTLTSSDEAESSLLSRTIILCKGSVIMRLYGLSNTPEVQQLLEYSDALLRQSNLIRAEATAVCAYLQALLERSEQLRRKTATVRAISHPPLR